MLLKPKALSLTVCIISGKSWSDSNIVGKMRAPLIVSADTLPTKFTGAPSVLFLVTVAVAMCQINLEESKFHLIECNDT